MERALAANIPRLYLIVSESSENTKNFEGNTESIRNGRLSGDLQ